MMQSRPATPLIPADPLALEWARAGSRDAPCTRTSAIEGLE